MSHWNYQDGHHPAVASQQEGPHLLTVYFALLQMVKRPI